MILRLRCEREGVGWRVSFVDGGIEMKGYGATKKEAYETFFGHIFDTMGHEKAVWSKLYTKREARFLCKYFEEGSSDVNGNGNSGLAG